MIAVEVSLFPIRCCDVDGATVKYAVAFDPRSFKSLPQTGGWWIVQSKAMLCCEYHVSVSLFIP